MGDSGLAARLLQSGIGLTLKRATDTCDVNVSLVRELAAPPQVMGQLLECERK